MQRDKVVKEATEWLGTAWQHQTSLKQVACDCVGLVRGVYREVSGIDVSIDEDYPDSWHLFRQEERLYEEAKRHMKEISLADALPGDILIFGFYHHPASHAGILIAPDRFIHSYQDIGSVIETRLDEAWRKRLRFAFRYPRVES